MSDFLKPDSEGRVDGRRLRSERSRLAFVDAVLVLQEEGVLVPTAQQIADLFATRLSKIASEGYEASPKSMRIRSRKGEISGIFSVFVALNGDVQREVLGKL
mgnify:CR=1 FL=1